MPGHLCTSWSDETNDERGVDSIMVVEHMQVDCEDDRKLMSSDHNDDDGDDNGHRTTG